MLLGTRRAILAEGWHIISSPIGFDWSYPVTIQQSGSLFRVREDVSSQFVEGVGIYYVDNTHGNDANTGADWDNALEKLSTAIAKADVTTVYVAPGHYDRSTGTASSGPAKSINIVKAGTGDGSGEVIVSKAQRGLVWVLDGVFTNTYTTTIATGTVYTVLDTRSVDGNGDYTELVAQPNAATVDANGGWYQSGTTLYVRLGDDVTPDDTTWPLIGESCLHTTGDFHVYLEGIRFIGGSSVHVVRIENSGAGQTPELLCKDCEFSWGAGNGVFVRGAFVWLHGCEARKNNADGFNYTNRNSIIATVIENRCVSERNGSNTNDDGSTGHFASNIIRVNSTYQAMTGPGIADTGVGETWCLGCDFLTNATYGAYTDGDMWLDRCAATGNTVADLSVAAGATIYTRNTAYVTTSGAGTISMY